MKTTTYLAAALLALTATTARAQCNASGSHYTASYPSGWTLTDNGDGNGTPSIPCDYDHNGTIYSTGTAAYFITSRSGRELRLSRSIPTLSDNRWTMDFTLRITTSPASGGAENNAPAATLASLTTDQQSIRTACTGGNQCDACSNGYPNTNMDAIWVALESEATSLCGTDGIPQQDWKIVAYARDGNGTPIASTPISIPAGATGDYFIRLSRNYSSAMLAVYSNSTYQTHLSGSPQCFSIPGSVTGLDCLNHEVSSQGVCWRVFNGIVDHLVIDNDVTCPLALHPSFTMATSVCESDPINVNGAASTSGTSMPIENHFWTVQECDANGNTSGPVWYSPFFSGAPGSYQITYDMAAAAGVYMTCGNRFKVKLVVANCGNPWAETSQVIDIKCPPTISMAGSMTTALSNNIVHLVVTPGGGNGSYFVDLSIVNYYPYGYSIPLTQPGYWENVFQYNPTTYYASVESDGCVSRMTWFVDMPSPRPAFEPVLTWQDASEFTLEAQPEDPDGASYTGFGYKHIIEELDPNDVSYYSYTSTDCWRRYPDPEPFTGFVSTGTGTYTQATAPTCGNPGRFLKGLRYRLTCVMWTQYTDPKQYSVIVYVAKSGQLVVEEDPKAPDLTHLSGQQPLFAVSIFPNPSHGLFTIEIGDETTGALIEVTDALGRQVKTLEQQGTQTELDLSAFPKGLYTVTITANERTKVKRIVLQ